MWKPKTKAQEILIYAICGLISLLIVIVTDYLGAFVFFASIAFLFLLVYLYAKYAHLSKQDKGLLYMIAILIASFSLFFSLINTCTSRSHNEESEKSEYLYRHFEEFH